MSRIDRRLRIAGHVHVRDFGGELIILDMAQGRYFSLDDIGMRVWKAIEQHRTSREIVATMLDEYAAEEERLLGDVLALTDDLIAKGLVEIVPENGAMSVAESSVEPMHKVGRSVR